MNEEVDFGKIFAKILEGQKVTRRSWSTGAYVWKHGDLVKFRPIHSDDPCNWMLYSPSHDDLIAKDWFPVYEPAVS